jgi:hypothetical protein
MISREIAASPPLVILVQAACSESFNVQATKLEPEPRKDSSSLRGVDWLQRQG